MAQGPHMWPCVRKYRLKGIFIEIFMESLLHRIEKHCGSNKSAYLSGLARYVYYTLRSTWVGPSSSKPPVNSSRQNKQRGLGKLIFRIEQDPSSHLTSSGTVSTSPGSISTAKLATLMISSIFEGLSSLSGPPSISSTATRKDLKEVPYCLACL